MITVYVLRSKTKNYTYVGFINNLSRHLAEHNSGFNISTKPYLPFELVYSKNDETTTDARKREKFLKSGKGREFIKSIVEFGAGSP